MSSKRRAGRHPVSVVKRVASPTSTGTSTARAALVIFDYLKGLPPSTTKVSSREIKAAIQGQLGKVSRDVFSPAIRAVCYDLGAGWEASDRSLIRAGSDFPKGGLEASMLVPTNMGNS